MTDLLQETEAEVRYHRERLAQYRARVSGSHPTTGVLLRKLEQESNEAEQRLLYAQREGRVPAQSRRRITSKPFGNDDWVKRDEGRIPTKGAAAAERASNGIGTLDDEAALRAEELPPKIVRRASSATTS